MPLDWIIRNEPKDSTKSQPYPETALALAILWPKEQPDVGFDSGMKYKGWSAAAYNYREEEGTQLGMVNVCPGIGGRHYGLLNFTLGGSGLSVVKLGSNSFGTDIGLLANLNFIETSKDSTSIAPIVYDGAVSGHTFRLGIATFRNGVDNSDRCKDKQDIRIGLFHYLDDRDNNLNNATLCLGTTVVISQAKHVERDRHYAVHPLFYLSLGEQGNEERKGLLGWLARTLNKSWDPCGYMVKLLFPSQAREE